MNRWRVASLIQHPIPFQAAAGENRSIPKNFSPLPSFSAYISSMQRAFRCKWLVQYHAYQRKYNHVRSELQEKGTRSAKRRLKAISGREKRFVQDQNHCISKKLANIDEDVSVYRIRP